MLVGHSEKAKHDGMAKHDVAIQACMQLHICSLLFS